MANRRSPLRGSIAALAVVFAACAGVGSASAGVVVYSGSSGDTASSAFGQVPSFAGPVLMDGVPVFAAGTGTRSRVWVGRDEASSDAPSGFPWEIGAANGFVALLRLQSVCTPVCYGADLTYTRDDVITGAWGAPLRYAFGCGAPAAAGEPACGQDEDTTCNPLGGGSPHLELSEDTVVASAPCNDDLTIENLRTGAISKYDPGPARLLLRFELAGPYIAMLLDGPGDARTLEVRDLRSGSLLYSSPAPETFALRDDGATLQGAGDGGVRLVTAADPAGQPVNIPSQGAAAWLWSGDRVAVVSQTVAHGPQTIRVVDLSGRPLASIAMSANLQGVAFDGQRLAWAERPCATPYAIVWDLSDPARVPLTEPTVCPAPRVALSSAPRAGQRRIAVRVACPRDAKRGCAGQLTLAVAARRLGPGTQLAESGFALDAGRNATLTVRLTRAQGRTIRARRWLIARASAPPSASGFGLPTRHGTARRRVPAGHARHR